MKYTTLFLTVIAFLVATVAAAASPGTNAERMARGLPPRAPRRLYRQRATPASPARRSQPSGTPGSGCSTLQCCQTVGTVSNPVIQLLLGLLGIVVQDTTTLIGATCSSVSDPASCSAQAVCCNDNSHGGLLAIDCTPVAPQKR